MQHIREKWFVELDIEVAKYKKNGVKQTQPSLQCNLTNKYLILNIWLVRINTLICSGNRNLAYTNEHKISRRSIPATVSTQQQFLQVVSCGNLSLFRISDKRKQQNIYIRLQFRVLSPSTGSLKSDN